MMSIESLTDTEPGAAMGICVCTADQSVETRWPPYACQNG